MNRRATLIALGGTLLPGWTLDVKAQGSKLVHRMGSLGLGLPPDRATLERAWAPARELGWVDGQNVIVERRFVGDKPELLRPYAEELVLLNVEIIATFGTAATIAARDATTRIPIVMVSAADPVRTGLVTSLARPGGNITGFSIISSDLDAKRLGLLHELLPNAQHVGVLVDRTDSYYQSAREEYELLYRSVGMQPIVVAVSTADEIERAVAEVVRRRAQALIVPADSIFYDNRNLVMRIAARHSLPTIVADRDFLEAGGLLCLSIDEAEQFRSFAYFVDKVLRGTKPADLPVQQPTRFSLSINLSAAKALRIAVPQSLLLRADEVIR